MAMQLIKGGTPYNSYADYDNGKQAITAFHNEMVKQWGDKYRITLNQLIEGLIARKGQKFFLDGLGLAITQSELSAFQVRSAMKTFVQKLDGKIPSTNGAFYGALNDEAQVFSLIDASSFTLVETAKTVVSGAAKVGESVIGVGSGVLNSAVSISENLKYILPIALFIAVGVYVYGSSK